MLGFFKFGKKARNSRLTRRNNKTISAAKKQKNPSGIMKLFARLAMGRKAASRRLATHMSSTRGSTTRRSAIRGSATRRSVRSRQPASLGPGMLTLKQFAAETKRIKAEIEEAEKKHRKALLAQQRATEMENGNAKKAATEAVDKAKTEVDLLMEQMAKLMSS
jgi:hypothetical protein